MTINQETREAREESAKKELEEIFQKRREQRDINIKKNKKKGEPNKEQAYRIFKQVNNSNSIIV